jgi:hypothetical protein
MELSQREVEGEELKCEQLRGGVAVMYVVEPIARQTSPNMPSFRVLGMSQAGKSTVRLSLRLQQLLNRPRDSSSIG